MFLPLLFAAAAIAGFHTGTRLVTPASFVAQKAITVNCANSQYDWNLYIQNVYGSSAVDTRGTATPGGDAVQLRQDICSVLGAAAKRTTPATPTAALGESILALAHESIHARGESDEGITDCSASHEMPRIAVKYFHVRAGKDLRTLMRHVAEYRAKEDPRYRTVC